LDEKAIAASAYGLWHTPRTMMVMETPENIRARMNRKRPGDRKNGLPNLVVQAIWATRNCIGSYAQTESSCQLSEEFLSWLMGIPVAENFTEPTETQSSLPLPPAS
jgi:hypothetical protein